MADPTQVVQYQTGLPPETALYGQELLGSTRGLIYDYAKDAAGKTIMVDPKTGEPTTDGSGIPQISGFKPYQQYTGDRVAQFTPLQQQAFQAAQNLGVDPATRAAAQGLQSLAQSAAGTTYNPFAGTAPQMQGPMDVASEDMRAASTDYNRQVGTGSFIDQGIAGAYMSPYMQNVVDVQQQQAKRQAAIAQQALAAQAARSGAFGGSGAALQRAQANAELQRNLQNIQATGLQNAYQQAMQQYSTDAARQLQAGLANQQTGLQTALANMNAQQQAAVANQAAKLQAAGMNQQAAMQTAIQNLQSRLQTQQLGEQSRQFGAGLGLQGIQTGISGMQAAGQMGQTAFGQQQAAIGLQNTLGTQQQQQTQNILNNQYQDFLNQQNLPYKQLGFMSDMIRGLPMSQTASTMYQAPPSNTAVLTGLTGAALTGGILNRASGGVVDSYADGGSVLSRENKEKIVGNLHPMGLPRAIQGAQMRGDIDTYNAAQSDMAEDAAIRRGIAAFAPYDMDRGFAAGGIVAFSKGGDEGRKMSQEEEDRLQLLKVPTALLDVLQSPAAAGLNLAGGVASTGQNFLGRLVNAVTNERTLPTDVSYPKFSMTPFYDKYVRSKEPKPSLEDRSDQDGGGITAVRETPTSSTEKKASSVVIPSIDTAITKMSEQSGVPKETLLDSYKALRGVIEKEGEPDRKEYMEMMKSFLGEGKKVREGATQKALQEFFLNMAAQGAQPGVARGKGIGQILQPAGAAAPSYMKSINESEKIAREMDSNDQKMMLLSKQFEMSQKAGDRKTAMELAMNMETIKRQQDQLQLQRDTLAETIRYHKDYVGVLAQKAAGSSGLQKAYLTGLTRADDRASRIAKDNWGKIDVRQDLKKQGFQTFDQYYDYVAKKERRKAVPIYGVTPASEKDDDLED